MAGYLWAIGLTTGELSMASRDDFTAPVIVSFLFLLLVHSLAAFTAMNWLLRHLPAAVVTTKFYVSPAIVAVAGWLVLGEVVGAGAMLGLALIFGGGAAVMIGETRRRLEPALKPDDADELEEQSRRSRAAPTPDQGSERASAEQQESVGRRFGDHRESDRAGDI